MEATAWKRVSENRERIRHRKNMGSVYLAFGIKKKTKKFLDLDLN
jgi:hypothetical protein